MCANSEAAVSLPAFWLTLVCSEECEQQLITQHGIPAEAKEVWVCLKSRETSTQLLDSVLWRWEAETQLMLFVQDCPDGDSERCCVSQARTTLALPLQCGGSGGEKGEECGDPMQSEPF